MAGQPSEPPPEPPSDGAGAAGDGPQSDAERFGPLALERRRKDDGRALIIYRRAEPEP